MQHGFEFQCVTSNWEAGRDVVRLGAVMGRESVRWLARHWPPARAASDGVEAGVLSVGAAVG